MLIEGTHYKRISTGKWKYELLHDVEFKVDLECNPFSHEYFEYYATSKVLLIRAGYAWDGATGAIDTPGVIGASLPHDVICQAYDLGMLNSYHRRIGDKLFYRLCIQYKESDFRSWYMYQAVRVWSRLRRLQSKYK